VERLDAIRRHQVVHVQVLGEAHAAGPQLAALAVAREPIADDRWRWWTRIDRARIDRGRFAFTAGQDQER
jgi:hypothetical protein